VDLEFGIWDSFEMQSGVDSARQYAERIALVRRAEDLGIAGYHVAEHHLSPLSMAPSPLVFLSAIAAATERIRLGALVVIVPLYPPIRLAEEICMVDGISGGRLEIGVGRGIRDVEHEWAGADPMTTREVFLAAFERIRTALETGEIAVDTPEGPTTVPFRHESTQRPTPPFWYVGNADFAAENGMRVLAHRPSAADVAAYRTAYEAHRAAGSPRHTHAPRIGSTRPIFVGANRQTALERARESWQILGDNWWTTEARVEGVSFPRGGKLGPGIPMEQAMEQGQLVVGSPDDVATALGDVLAYGGPDYDYLVNGFQWGNLTHEDATGSLELFAAEVMPALRGVHAGLAAPAESASR
jgi:alkanesulfonate monooxygenase SsuD/methylene tetrahydromethanopterin reductase-like flavin-dependent oxidoreductase (luciferase family)